MTETGKKWLIGCSIATLLGVLVLAALAWGAVSLIRKAGAEIEELESSSRALSERYGRASDFTPDPGGAISADRMEAFLAARDILAQASTELSDALATLDGSGGDGGSKLGAGFKLLPRVFRFYGSRSEACLEAGIGLGEYGYLYILSYYDLLGKPVTAGPGFTLVGESDDGGSPGVPSTDFEVRDLRRERVLRSARDLALPILRNQLAAIPEAETGGSWAGRLQEEIALLESDPYRLPWRDGLPERIATSLEPFRERLESSWNEMSNALEIGPQLN